MNNSPSRRARTRTKPRLDSFRRREWQRATEAKTRVHRIRRASHHEGKAREARLHGRPKTEAWHARRAIGQLRCFDKVRDCGGSDVMIKCEGCGFEVKRIEARCGHYRICVTCRGARASLLRYRFRLSRERALRRSGRLMRARREGRWSEKFVTLTLRHGEDVERDIKVLPQAWRLFRKELWSHFRLDRGLDFDERRCLTFVRVLEITPGSQGTGHAHIHVYLLSPFVPKALIRHLWGAALVKLGYSVPTEPMDEVLEGPSRRVERSCVGGS